MVGRLATRYSPVRRSTPIKSKLPISFPLDLQLLSVSPPSILCQHQSFHFKVSCGPSRQPPTPEGVSLFFCLGTIMQFFRTPSAGEAELIGSFFTQAPQEQPLALAYCTTSLLCKSVQRTLSIVPPSVSPWRCS